MGKNTLVAVLVAGAAIAVAACTTEAPPPICQGRAQCMDAGVGAAPVDCWQHPYGQSCAPCRKNEDCAPLGDDYLCDSNGACVLCLDASDCSDDQACVRGVCEDECRSHDDCEGRPDRPSCHLGTGHCVPCTPDTEESTCGDKSCDLRTFTCGPHVRGSRENCETCVADSDCGENHRCVPMRYRDVSRPGGYCLKVADGCAQPFATILHGRRSLSGAVQDYCGIAEGLTTCEAVRGLVSNWHCENDGACQLASDWPEFETPGAICRTVGLLSGTRCTYRCSDADQCKATPSAASTCGNGGDPQSDSYCGG